MLVIDYMYQFLYQIGTQLMLNYNKKQKFHNNSTLEDIYTNKINLFYKMNN